MKKKSYLTKRFLFISSLLIAVAGSFTPLFLYYETNLIPLKTKSLKLIVKLKDALNDPICKIQNEKIVCDNSIIKIVNEVPEIIDKQNTIRLINWFTSSVAYGPEVLLLDSILLSKSKCSDSEEPDCSGLTKFYDSQKSRIVLFPQTILKGLEYLSEPLIRKISFNDFTYYIAHEYYHHMTQQLLYDLLPKGASNSASSKVTVDSAGISLKEDEGDFSSRKNQDAVNQFMRLNNLESNSESAVPVSGIASKNCPLVSTSKSSIYNWANKLEIDNCRFTWTFPPFQTKSENHYYPKNAPFIKPTSLINCGYFAGDELPSGNIKYYFSLDEILVRQLTQLTYVKGTASQIGSKIACNNAIAVKGRTIGLNNNFLLDYYLLQKMGLSPFFNKQDYDYLTATALEREEQEKVKENFATTLLKYFFQQSKNISSLMYDPVRKAYSLGGYLTYDNTIDSFVKNEGNRLWKVKDIVAINTVTRKKHVLGLKKRHNLFFVNHFNAIDPITKEVDKNTEVTKLNQRNGYATDWFIPPSSSYEFYFRGSIGNQENLFPITNTNNKPIWVNHGEDPDIRRFKLEFNVNSGTYYADFKKNI